ncbi:MAG: ATP-binding protein, partial [Oscillospiraceae bacterium]|nr:ATP-binding protein [Oscillospiraceae bacterium]
MIQTQIYEQAIAQIGTRRRAAQMLQEQRTDEIRTKIPETAELDRQLRTAYRSLAGIIGKGDNSRLLREIEQHTREADAMLRSILTAHGYPADYLDVHYTCEKCNDTGFVGGKPCTCLIQEIGRLGAEQLNARSRLSLSSFAEFSLSYYQELPPEQYHAMEQNLAFCKQYAEQFSPTESCNLFLHGGTGLGKTHLSLAVANVLLQKGFTVIYDSLSSLLHILEQEQFSRGRSDEEDTLAALLECDLLILDDFGAEFDTSFSRSMIYTILNSRMNACKPLIVNTNLTTGEIKEKYG